MRGHHEPGRARVHSEKVRVRYGDTDQMGVVYYANYLRWFEVGRAEWLRSAGMAYREIEALGVVFPVTEAHIKYRASARYDDLVRIDCWPSRVRAVSLHFEYHIFRDRELLAEGTTGHACLDARGKLCRFPESVRALFASGAGET